MFPGQCFNGNTTGVPSSPIGGNGTPAFLPVSCHANPFRRQVATKREDMPFGTTVPSNTIYFPLVPKFHHGIIWDIKKNHIFAFVTTHITHKNDKAMNISYFKKSCLFLLTVLLFAVQPATCEPISRQKALRNVSEFLEKRGFNVQGAALRQAPLKVKGGEAKSAPYYVFNIGNGEGFVIASGDDRSRAILGYSDQGTLDTDSMPDGLKSMLDFYEEQIQSCSNSSNAIKVSSSTAYPAVEPMLTTKWGQKYPYNANCPINPSTNGRCATGCVATAMAQVMYYHRKNSTGEIIKDIPSYVSYRNQIEVGGISKGSPIDWENMLDEYGESATEAQEQAVANLMLYCGTSVKMDYGGSSGAFTHTAAESLVTYFDYDDNTSYKYRDGFTDSEWETMVYEELGKGNPILYAGGGHAYVVDGHDGNGYVHVNWGVVWG